MLCNLLNVTINNDGTFVGYVGEIILRVHSLPSPANLTTPRSFHALPIQMVCLQIPNDLNISNEQKNVDANSLELDLDLGLPI